MNKKLDSYNETLFHLINFRCRQFRESRSMIGIDYDSFMICSVIGAHFLKHNTQEGANWDAVWETTRTKKVDENYKDRKLTIFAVANVLDLPKETVRRKIEILKNKKLISHSSKLGLLPTQKIEEFIKPFAEKELYSLSDFLKQLKNHKSLDPLLNLKRENQ
jgi:predicted transcriptional regulator